MNASHPNLKKWSAAVLLWTVMFFVLGQLILSVLSIPDTPPFLRERFASRAWPAVPPVEASIVNWQVANSVRRSKPVDVLLLGDSSCLMGIKPTLMERELNLSCWNLGSIGTLGTSGHAALLAFWVKQCGSPKILVYHIVPDSLTKSSPESQFWGKLLQDWMSDGQRDFSESLPSSIVRRYALYQLIALANLFGVENERLNAGRGVYPSDREVEKILLANNGWFPECMPTVHREKWNITDFPNFHSDCLAGLKRIFEISKQNNFSVLLVMHDVPDIYLSDSTRRVFEDYERALLQAANGFPNVHVAKPFLRTIPVEQCVSRNHVSPRGAETHSRLVSRLIKDSLRLAATKVERF